MLQRPVTEVLVKPAGPDCNLDCAYCFYTCKSQMFPSQKTRMNEMVLETMIKQLLAQPIPQISIGWQGGEPTLMGIPFYRKALELMQRYGHNKTIANGLQTNGMLIDNNWAELFRKHRFLVGLSLDGPQHVHDRYRVDHAGRGSWQKAADAARLLLDQGVEVNVLSVVNDYSVRFPEEIYAFHKAQGLNFMQFIPCVESGHSEGSRLAQFSVPADAYGDFLCKVFDLWLADFVDATPTTSIRFFEALLFKYAGFPPTECTLLEECGSYLLIEHTGDVYACDFYVDQEWKLGNLLETALPGLLNAPLQVEFGRLKARLPADCLSCAWRTQCRGGCMKDRLLDLAGPNYLCAAYKKFFSYADSHLKALVAAWKRKTRNE